MHRVTAGVFSIKGPGQRVSVIFVLSMVAGAAAGMFPAPGATSGGGPVADEPWAGALEYAPPHPDYPGDLSQLGVRDRAYSGEPAARTPTAVYNRTLGDHVALMILVDFPDVSHAAANTQAKYDLLANGNSSTNRSMRTFFIDNTAGACTLNVTVVDWVTMPENMANYSTVNGQKKIAGDAANAANCVVNFSQFDEDGDGYVDNLIIVHAGADQALSGNSSHLWSHMGLATAATVDGCGHPGRGHLTADGRGGAQLHLVPETPNLINNNHNYDDGEHVLVCAHEEE